MKIANVLKALLIGGMFLLVTSITGSLLFELSFWEALIIGIVIMIILGVVFAFEGDRYKD